MNDLRARLEASLSTTYRLERELGSGGMAVVYLARDLRHKRRVALKVLRPEISALIGPERFLREIETLANLTHPHILPLHDSCEADGLLFYVMPYVDGESLRERLLRERQLPLDDALRIAREVADALSHAHSRGVIHRDIKPENILFSGGHALVADFGIAAAIDVAGDSRLTETGIAMGTPAYMSPEQALGERTVDARTDIYALGCVLYEMLAGEPPFTGPTAQAILVQRLREPAPSIRAFRAGIPDPVENAISRMLASQPGERFQATSDLTSVLAIRMSPSPANRKRTLSTTALLASVAAVGVLIAGYVVLDRGPARQPIQPGPIAVLPVSVTGTGLELWWREGVMELLSTNLDGMGGLRTISPQTVLARHRERLAASLQPDLHTSLEIAKSADAQYALVGRAVTTGTNVRLSLTVYDVATGNVLGRAQRENSADSLFSLVDRISIDVVSNILGSNRVGLAYRRLDAITTHSVPAVRFYLEGVSAFRQAAYAKAIPLFERAVEEDSTFALAWHYLATSYNLQGAGGTQTANQKALKYIHRLPAREAAFLRIATAGHEVLDLARRTAAQYPDDPEAAFLFGDQLLHNGAGRLVDQAEAAGWFDRAIRLDSTFPHNFAHYYQHVIELAAQSGDTTRARHMLDTYARRVLPDDAFLSGYRLVLATLRSHSMQVGLAEQVDTVDELALQWATARLVSNTPPVENLYANGTFELWPRALEAAEAINLAWLKRVDYKVVGSEAAAVISLWRGQIRQARDIVTKDSRVRSRYRPQFYYRLLELGYTLPTDVLERELGVRAQDTPAVRNLIAGAHAAETKKWQAHELALTNERGRLVRATALGDTTLMRTSTAFVQGLEAYGNIQRGQASPDAMNALEQARSSTGGVANMMFRWWLGKAHAAAGRDADALRYFSTFAMDPVGQLELARLAEKRNDQDAARRALELLAEVWKDADADFKPAQEAQQALARLTRKAEIR